MANISIQNWDNIRTPRFSYVDESLTIKTTTTVFEQGFSLTQANALINLNDQKTNNYSMLYLTTSQNVSDIVELDTLEYTLKSLTTYLRFRSYSGTFKYVKFVPDTYAIVDVEAQDDSTRFQLSFIDHEYVIVKHIDNRQDFKLCIFSDDTIAFALNGTSTDYTLKYVIDTDGYITLYKNSTPTKILSIQENSLIVSPLVPGSLTRTGDQLIEINYSYTALAYNIDQNWVGYDRKDLNLANIDSNRSAFNLPNQFVVTTSYNNIADTIDVNFFNLKNNVSEGNFIKRGSILDDGPVEVPGVSFRFYTSLNTGNDQERGNENIVLTYVFYDKDIVAKPGTDTAFKTSDTIYPYDRLNINDAKFIENGAYGSYAPNISDNIQKLRKNSSGFNNGRYLCTWLSGNGNNNGYVWVDRYYYPDIISKENAYTLPIYNPSFLDPVDRSAYAVSNKSMIANQPLFDKKSDLFLEPDTSYIYKRVSTDDLESHILTLSSYNVLSQPETVVLDGGTSFPIEVDSINDNGQFTIAFDLYLTPNKTYGQSILGNLTNYGFSVLNDTFITPILVTLSGNNVFYHNTYPADIGSQTFNKPVKDVIRFDGLDNYLTVCEEGYVYEVKYDNTINRLEIIPSLSSYIGYASSENEVSFLIDTAGTCVTYHKLSATATVSTANFSSLSVGGIYYSASGIEGVEGANVKKYDTTHVCYLTNNTIYKYNTVDFTATPIVKALSGISDYAVDNEGNFIFLHNTDKLTLLNKNRLVMFTQTLSSIPLSGHKCEFIRQYDFGQLTQQIAVAGADINGNTQIAMYDYEGIMRGMAQSEGNLLNTHTNFTNYNYYINSPNNMKSLRFKIVLENLRNNQDITERTLTYDYSLISEGWVSLAYVFDSLRGSISLYVNGAIHDTTSFDPGKYKVTRIFNDRIIVGSTGFYNGISLPDFLQQPNYYYTTGTSIRNLYVFSTPLKAGDLNAINLLDTEIQPLTLSIPAGQRSNIEEIIRYFKFSVPGSKSNHINIEVKNSGIADTQVQEALKANIRLNITKYLKSDVVIDDITFVDYSTD